jgi:hypothetical protein
MPQPPSDDELTRACYLLANALAFSNGTTPRLLTTQLRQLAATAGQPLKSDLDDASLLPALRHAYDILSTGTEPDLAPVRAQLDLAVAEVRGHPPAFQSLTVLATGAGLVIVLAIIGKLKVKNGKWELVPGLPGFEHVAKLFPTIFAGG